MTLSNNTFQGKIPPEIGRLFRLEYLRLGHNSLEGEIPANIFRCSNLVNLNFSTNKLVGKIPEELGSLSKLKVLSIYHNNLIGGISRFIGNLTSLEFLSVSFNKLGGSIPDVFHRLKNLKQIGLGGTQLSGIIPPSLYNLSHLTFLSLAENQLQGSLPLNFGHLFPHLQYLQIRNNNFTGKVTVDFSGMKHLKIMAMLINNLGTGEAGDLKFITSLLNCSNLKDVSIGVNQFGGELPNFVGNFSTQLTALDMSQNQISGRIPPWIATISTLNFLGMNDNQFIGPIPKSIGKLHNLNRMYLYNNRLSGKIPPSLGNLSSLTLLSLLNNRLNGTIPSSLGNCYNLLAMYLSQNSFTGAIPTQLFNNSTLSIVIDLSQNHLVGSLPPGVGSLKNLEQLYISENQLSGEIPNTLGGCTSLENLNMRGNFFHGSIPQSLTSLMGIQQLDLSRNNLSGEIPDFLENFPLTYLNLSFNDFEGEVPTKGVFGNATAISILGNKRLCGGISELKLSSCSTKESNKKRNISSLAIILITIACSLLAVSFFSLFIYFRFKRKRNEQSSGSIQTHRKVSYAMLLKATNNFSVDNLIGVGSFGSVYKGILDQNEQIVAIKVLNLQRRGASKSFTAECEALRNIRHRNLVKIITSCSSVDFQGNEFKALVYEFMHSGSLESWLHPIPESSQSLILLQRVNIAIDVAFALDYLHHHCQPPIVHCDLKPNNILLDGDMSAHVGDFGLAKFLQKFITPNQSSSIGIRGTIGYAAPEYGVGSEVSTSGDVYSFGILLLEMMTGKKPTDNMFEEGLNLHKFSSMAFPHQVMEIVDPILLSNLGEAEKQCLISMVNIGVACSMESHQDRKDMNDVLHELQLIKNTLQGTGRRRNMHEVHHV